MARKMRKHDWPSICGDYVEGWQTENGRYLPTMQEVALKHGVRVGYLREVAGLQDWTDKRAEFKAKLERERNKIQARALATKGAQFNDKVLALAEKALDMIAARIVDLETPDEQGKQKTASFHDLSRLGLALRHAQVAGALALGEDPMPIDLTPGAVQRNRGRTLYVELVDKPPPDQYERADADG